MLELGALDMVDIRKPEVVEVSIAHDGKTMWVNVEGRCRLRICAIKTLVIEDARKCVGELDE